MTDADQSKRLVALLVIALASLMLWADRLDGDQWVAAVTWTVTAYILGQVGAVVATGWAVATKAKAEK